MLQKQNVCFITCFRTFRNKSIYYDDLILRIRIMVIWNWNSLIYKEISSLFKEFMQWFECVQSSVEIVFILAELDRAVDVFKYTTPEHHCYWITQDFEFAYTDDGIAANDMLFPLSWFDWYLFLLKNGFDSWYFGVEFQLV